MAVLSDLHASTNAPGRTWVREGQEPAFDPFAKLEGLIEETEELSADVLLCPGDLIDQADWDALPYAWGKVKGVAEKLGAEQIIATVGNHDIDSRGVRGTDQIHEGLLRLAPEYPCHPGGDPEHYWDNRISHVRGDCWQVVSLNSCLMRYLQDDEKDHGEIDDQTLDRVRALVEGIEVPINVLLCHHHPQPFTRIIDDRSHMEAGDRLVRLLDELPGIWMIVHGHKHEPFLDYMTGTGAAPTRLVAGSVGVNLYPALSLHVRNQLHLLEFPVDSTERLHLPLAGRVRSWTWQPTTHWRPAIAGDGLPAVAGFGFRRDGPSLAAELIEMAGDRGLRVLERADLEDFQPRLSYLLPSDLEAFQSQLENGHGCHVSVDRRGNLDRVVLAP